jgi:hypothetical protein
MATLTATSYLREPRQVHVGVIGTTFRYNSGATATSIGDVILLAKVPWGTTITEFVESHTSGATAQGIDFGYDSDVSAFVAAGAQGTANRLVHRGMSVQFTGSDDASARYSVIKAKVATGTGTTSTIISGNIQYTVGD